MAGLSLGLGLGLSTRAISGGTPTPTPTPTPLLAPSTSWDGTTSWVGRTVPTESTTPLGTLVQDEKFGGYFSAVPGMWVHGSGKKITVLGLPPQPTDSTTINYFKEAVFWLEGTTTTVTNWSVSDNPVLMPDGTTMPQGSIGFTVEIGAGLGSIKSGDAVLYCTLRGDHGLERLVSLPIVVNVDSSLDPVGIDFTVSPGGLSAGTLTSSWTGATGTYTVFFSSTSSRVSRVITLTNGLTAATWTGGTAPASSGTRAWLNRPKFFVDYTNGSDSNIGNKSGSGNAWKTHLKAHTSVLNGSYVEMANGTYLEDSNTGTGSTQTRMVEFRPSSSWTNAGDIVISRTTRLSPAREWNPRIQKCHYFGVTVDMTKIVFMYGTGNPCVLAFSAYRMTDVAANGPVDGSGYDIGYNVTAGTAAQQDGATIMFQGSNGARTYLTEGEYTCYHMLGAFLYRNVTGAYATDAFASGGNAATEADNYDNVVVDNYIPTAIRSFQQRMHLESELTVASTAFNTPTAGKTTITMSGSPTLANSTTARTDTGMQVVTGSMAGTYFAAPTQASATFTVVVNGDATGLVAGDKVRTFVIWHGDFAQQQGVNTNANQAYRGNRNWVMSRYDGSGPYTQLFLIQASTDWLGSPPTVTLQTSGGDGRDITFSTSSTWRDGDVVRLLDGPQAGEYTMMDGDGTGLTSGRIKWAFSTAQGSARASKRGKTLDGFVMYCSRLRKTSVADDPAVPGRKANEFGQFAEGSKNFVMAHNTFLGARDVDLVTIGWRNNITVTGNIANDRANTTAHGNKNSKFLFNVIGQIYSDVAPFPSVGLKLQRNQFMTGTDPDGSGQVGSTTLDPTTSLPDSGCLTIGVQPLVPFDINGNPITSSSKCGYLVQ